MLTRSVAMLLLMSGCAVSEPQYPWPVSHGVRRVCVEFSLRRDAHLNVEWPFRVATIDLYTSEDIQAPKDDVLAVSSDGTWVLRNAENKVLATGTLGKRGCVDLPLPLSAETKRVFVWSENEDNVRSTEVRIDGQATPLASSRPARYQ